MATTQRLNLPGRQLTRRFVYATCMAALPGLGALALYLYTTSPSPGWIDSGELAAVAHTLGVAHPTGSPVYILLARLFVVLFPGAFFPLVLLSAVAVAAGLMLLVGAPARILKTRLSVLAGSLVALVLAVAPSVWEQAIINEVYALQFLLFALFLRTWWRPTSRTQETIMAYIAGLAFANHQTALFLAPFLVQRLWPLRRRLRVWLRALLFALIGVTPYLWLPVRSAAGPLLDWGGTERPAAFWRHITGWQYSGWVGAGSWDELALGIGDLGGWFWSNFPWLLLPLALIGLLVLVRRERGTAATMGSALLLCCGFALNFDNPDIQAFYLLAFIVTAIWVGVALAWLFSRSATLRVLVVTGVLLSLVVSLRQNYGDITRRGFHVPSDWVLDALETVEPGGVVLTGQWDHYAPWLYLRLVRGVRDDVLWINTNLLRRSWYPTFIRRIDPERYARARNALDRLAPRIARFESGRSYDAAEIERAYAEAIYALSLGQEGPVYADGVGDRRTEWLIPREYLRGAAEVPWGLLTHLVRPGDSIPRLPSWPQFRNSQVRGRQDARTVYHLDLYRQARLARMGWR
jgi:hypothetical protein